MDNLSLAGLFMSAFISATLAPGGSEAVLGYMALNATQVQTLQLIGIATLGNTLGALTTWGLGLLAAKKYPLESVLSASQQRAINWVKNGGYWTLLFSWLPVVGDGFCFAGGWLKLPFLRSSLIILLGKTIRYCAVVYLVRQAL